MPTDKIIEKTENIADIKTKDIPKGSYYEAVGRRKSAVARVRLFNKGKDKSDVTINGKSLKDYFPTDKLQKTAISSLEIMKADDRFKVTAKITGGGIQGQAEALRHALARALVEFNLEFRKRLKKATFLKRDPRVKERRKFGLKKARKSPQWSKR